MRSAFDTASVLSIGKHLALLSLTSMALACRPPASLFEQGQRPLQNVALPRAISSVSVESCDTCHREQTEQWRASRHAVAFTNPVFAASWDHSPQGWCVNCHAPLPEQKRAVIADRSHAREEPLPQEGVNCAACHVRDGAILTSSADSPPSAQDAHPIRYEPSMGTSEFCAGCHQFNFPIRGKQAVRYSRHPLQNTLGELEGTGTDATCQDCHMGEHGHRFPGAHDPTMLSGISVRAVRRSFEVQLEVSVAGVPHSVPTGDPFRRIEVVIAGDSECTEPVARKRLMRVADSTRKSWKIVHDSTIPPARLDETGVRQLKVSLKAEDPEDLYWCLRYYYGDSRLEADLPSDEVLVQLASGPVD